MNVFSVVVRDRAIGHLSPRAVVERHGECPECHRVPAPVVKQVDYELTSWDGEEWLLVEGAHVVGRRVQMRLARVAGDAVEFRDAVVTATAVECLPFFQIVKTPMVRAPEALHYEWFCESCLLTAFSPTPAGQRCLASARLHLSPAAWGDLAVGAVEWWPWLLVSEDACATLRALPVSNVEYVPVEWD